MGQGGYITLVNGTPYNWVCTYNHSYQMNSWKFPDIASGKTAHVYVEWDQGIFKTVSDDSGDATYSLQGTPYSFSIQARANKGFDLAVVLSGISTQGNAQNSRIDLGWSHDGSVVFVLAGTSGSFISNNPPAGWMANNRGTLGNRTLRQLCMPGSHDAGMSLMNGSTAGAFSCNVLTQSQSIYGQLLVGSRYFDIRPVLGNGGQYLTGHYSQIGSSWQGANGQSIDSIIADVNKFTASYGELVVLNLSHDLNTDVGNSSYRPLNQSEWDALFQKLSGLKNLYVAPAGTADLTQLTLSSYLAKGAAVVVVVDPSAGNISLGKYAGQGFYPASAYPLYNSYSDSNDLNKMSADQLQKMRNQRPNPNAQAFLLSWTLTQDSTQAVTCVTGIANSILDLAALADPTLYQNVLPACTGQTYPNVLYIDQMNSSAIIPMAMAVNTLGATK